MTSSTLRTGLDYTLANIQDDLNKGEKSRVIRAAQATIDECCIEGTTLVTSIFVAAYFIAENFLCSSEKPIIYLGSLAATAVITYDYEKIIRCSHIIIQRAQTCYRDNEWQQSVRAEINSSLIWRWLMN